MERGKKETNKDMVYPYTAVVEDNAGFIHLISYTAGEFLDEDIWYLENESGFKILAFHSPGADNKPVFKIAEQKLETIKANCRKVS